MTGPAAVQQAVLLVGGLGTRLRPLTYHTPKPLLPLLNRPLISYELELLGRAGVTDVTLAVAYQADALREALGDGSRWGVALRYVEDPFPLDTAGAIKQVEPHLTGPFLAMNGDTVLDLDLAAVVEAHLSEGADLTILLRRVEDISPFGLVQRDDAGFITAFCEKVDCDDTGQNTINAGLYVISPRVLERIPTGEPCSIERQLFPQLLAEGHRLLGYLLEPTGFWADVGRVETYLATSHALLDGAIDWVQPTIESPTPPGLIATPVCIGSGCEIAGRVGPHVTLGEDCVVEPGAILRDCIVLARARIGAGALVERAIVAAGARVPAGEHLTNGVYASDD